VSHRAVAGSKRGRQLTGAKGAREARDWAIPEHVRAKNAAIDAARATDLAMRKARREGKS
jgi:hypothetical protein